MESRTLTATEVAKHLGVSRTTFYNMISRGKFTVPCIPGTDPRRWTLNTVDKWLDSSPDARYVDETPRATNRFIRVLPERDVTYQNDDFVFSEPKENHPHARYVRSSEVVEVHFMDSGAGDLRNHYAKAILKTGEKVWIHTPRAQMLAKGGYE